MTETILEFMVKLQDSLNEEIVRDWKFERSIQEFETECLIEIGEVLECSPHKWWKYYSEEDLKVRGEKIKLELVDVLHFALSGLILKGRVTKEDPTIIPFETANNENYKKLYDLARSHNFMGLIQQLTNLAYCLKFDIFGFYIAKYVLNRIRLLKGYKDGSYGIIDDNRLLLTVIPSTTGLTVLSDIIDQSERARYKVMINNIYDKFQIPESDRRYVFK